MNCLCTNTVIVLNVAILLIILVSGIKGFQGSEAKEVRSDDSSGCWSTANITCIKAIILEPFKDIWNKKEIRLTDSAVIERTANISAKDNGTVQMKSAEESQGRGYGDVDQTVENIGKFLSTHALRINLWNFTTLRIERSQENPENFEIIFYTNRGSTDIDSRGKCYNKIFLLHTQST